MFSALWKTVFPIPKIHLHCGKLWKTHVQWIYIPPKTANQPNQTQDIAFLPHIFLNNLLKTPLDNRRTFPNQWFYPHRFSTGWGKVLHLTHLTHSKKQKKHRLFGYISPFGQYVLGKPLRILVFSLESFGFLLQSGIFCDILYTAY
ncbi:MAG: hypothetical protein E7631_08875 [Ruminococcaceae bacterium]|nr:hypothetical protein [Oscillospiraceae bacterium]